MRNLSLDGADQNSFIGRVIYKRFINFLPVFKCKVTYSPVGSVRSAVNNKCRWELFHFPQQQTCSWVNVGGKRFALAFLFKVIITSNCFSVDLFAKCYYLEGFVSP